MSKFLTLENPPFYNKSGISSKNLQQIQVSQQEIKLLLNLTLI